MHNPSSSLPDRPHEPIRIGTGLPLRITLLLVLVLTITVLSAVRAYTALAWHSTLASYVSPALVVYVGISGAAWTLAGIFILWSFYRGARYTWLLILLATAGYTAWAWVDRLLLQVGARANWLFALVGTIALLAFVAFVVLHPATQSYFGRESHEPRGKEQTTP